MNKTLPTSLNRSYPQPEAVLLVMNMDASTPVISIKEARKLLGREASSYSDDKVEELIIGLDCIALEYYKLVPSVIIDRDKKSRKGSKWL